MMLKFAALPGFSARRLFAQAVELMMHLGSRVLGGIEQGAIEPLEFPSYALKIIVQMACCRVEVPHELLGEDPLAHDLEQSLGSGEQIRQAQAITIEKLGLARLNQGGKDSRQDGSHARAKKAVDG